MKTLYEFQLEKQVEVDKVEEREENGQKVSVTTKIKEPKKVFFAIKKPNREEREEAEMVRASYLSYCISRGILTEAMLSKTYANYGGVMTNDEQKYYAGLLTDYSDKRKELEFSSITQSDASKERLQKLNEEIIALGIKIRQFQNEQSLFFENTAEAKARNRMIEYLALFLTYHKNEEKGEYKPYFKGETLQDRIKYSEGLEEKEGEFYVMVRNKITLFTSFFVNGGDSLKPEDYAKLDSEFKF